ncbi:hypothetical protein ACMHYB_37750 [Sorangium sp. So ce1128]
MFMSLMQRTLQFKHHLRVEPGGDKETLFLIGERERFMLRGRLAELDGGAEPEAMPVRLIVRPSAGRRGVTGRAGVAREELCAAPVGLPRRWRARRGRPPTSSSQPVHGRPRCSRELI